MRSSDETKEFGDYNQKKDSNDGFLDVPQVFLVIGDAWWASLMPIEFLHGIAKFGKIKSPSNSLSMFIH